MIELVAAELGEATQAQIETARAATHEEARPENDKDTRAIEASYLARGQARRVAELDGELALLRAFRLGPPSEGDAISVGAVVAVRDAEGALELFFILPAGGGRSIFAEGRSLRTITGRAPLGRALLGARVGDDVEVEAPHGPREVSVVGLR